MKKESSVMSNTGPASDREASEQNPSDAGTSPAATEAGRGAWWSSSRTAWIVAAVTLVAAIVFGALWVSDDSADRLQELQNRLDVEAEAEAVASEYALRVSEVDYRDLDGWKAALTDGVSEQLTPKLEGAVDVVAPWLTQMEYTAEARLLAAEASTADDGSWVVQVFVDMVSKSKQTPDGVAATATYRVTMDQHSDWTITDVGGVGAGLPGTGGADAPAPESPADTEGR